MCVCRLCLGTRFAIACLLCVYTCICDHTCIRIYIFFNFFTCTCTPSGFCMFSFTQHIKIHRIESAPNAPPLSWRYGEGGVSQLKCLEFITWDVNGQRDNVQPKKNGCFQVGENGGILYKSVESEKDLQAFNVNMMDLESLHWVYTVFECCERAVASAWNPRLFFLQKWLPKPFSKEKRWFLLRESTEIWTQETINGSTTSTRHLRLKCLKDQ